MRMYNQRGKTSEIPPAGSTVANIACKASGKLYKNPLDCLIQTVRAEGPLAVYKVHPSLPPPFPPPKLHSPRDFLRTYYGLHRIPFCIAPLGGMLIAGRYRLWSRLYLALCADLVDQ
jgi:hypothetical protein